MSSDLPRESSESDERMRPRVWPWLVGILCMGVAFVGVIALAFLHQAGDVRADLIAAQTKLQFVPGIVAGNDIDGLNQVAAEVTELTAHANETVQGPLWKIAESIPLVGANVAATHTLTRVADVLVKDALPVVVEILTTLRPDQLALAGGGFNLEPFRQVQASLPVIREALVAASGDIDGIDRAGLLPELSGPLEQLTGVVAMAGPTLETVEKYLPTMLNMAGAAGPRSYLVIFQNNAEIRATGGNPAASMVISVDGGRIQLNTQSNSMDFYELGTIGATYTSLPPESLSLYRESFTQFSQDYTMTPDFPTTAQLFQDLWRATSGGTYDGVISVDPTVLSHILAVTGPIQLADGEEINSENAVRILLSDSYERFPEGGEVSDAFFADVASRVFAKLTEGGWDPLAMIQALVHSAQEQRLYLSFVDPTAQALAVEYGLDGALRESTETKTQVGLYLINSSVSKLEYHLTTAVSATCDAAARTISVTTTLANSITDAVTSPYALGFRNPTYGIPPTTMMLDVLYFAPPGATILSTDPEVGDVAEWQRFGVEKGNSALSKTVFVAQGETRTVGYTVQLGAGALGPLELRHSPTANPTAVSIDESCSALFPPAPAGTDLLGALPAS